MLNNHIQEIEWRDWARKRLEELVAAVPLDDKDFDIPDDRTILEARNFVELMSHQSAIAKIGRPRIWLSQNADFIFEWTRRGAKLEFKFTPTSMHVFVKTGDDVFTEVHQHADHNGLEKAISIYHTAA